LGVGMKHGEDEESLNLFGTAEPEPELPSEAPLADRVRPRTLDELVGQDHILGPGRPLRRAIESDELFSMIFWGPPGSGKTTIAKIIESKTKSEFISFSAVISGVADIRKVIERARKAYRSYGRRTILFIDEIHHFNKAQQDAFLPHVEDGTIILIGSTTENPSFEVNPALLSRTKVYVLNPLSESDLKVILERALKDSERGLGRYKMKLEEGVLDFMANYGDGDARRALNVLEMAVMVAPPDKDGVRVITLDLVQDVVGKKALLYDKAGEEHYNLISALHKSVRGSDPDAAIYWLTRMLEAGEDPLYIARRLVRMAVEDIGAADPMALSVATAAKDAYHFLGSPEGELALVEAAVYLATAPKSNALYKAFNRAREDVRRTGSLPVPLHIRNAPTKLMKDLGYGRDYRYDHDFEDSFSGQEHLPEELRGRRYYEPTNYGHEKTIRKRMEFWERRRREIQRNESGGKVDPSEGK